MGSWAYNLMTNEVYIVIFTLYFQTVDTFSFISSWNSPKKRDIVVLHNFFDGQNPPLFFLHPFLAQPHFFKIISDSPLCPLPLNMKTPSNRKNSCNPPLNTTFLTRLSDHSSEKWKKNYKLLITLLQKLLIKWIKVKT